MKHSHSVNPESEVLPPDGAPNAHPIKFESAVRTVEQKKPLVIVG